MEISAIARATSAALEKQTEPVNPDKGLVDKFSQLMQQEEGVMSCKDLSLSLDPKGQWPTKI